MAGMDYSRDPLFKSRQLPKQPWFGTKERFHEIVIAAESRFDRLATVPTAKGPIQLRQNCRTEVDIGVEGSLESQSVPLAELSGHLRPSTKKIRVDARCIDQEGNIIAQIVISLDRNGIDVQVASVDSDWVDATIGRIKDDIRESQNRWLVAKSSALRTYACGLGVLDSAIIGLLIAFAIGHLDDGPPQLWAGLVFFFALSMVLSVMAFRLTLFEITTENHQALYLYLLRVLVVVLFFGVIIEVLVNIAT
jgi:hypothetical protein